MLSRSMTLRAATSTILLVAVVACGRADEPLQVSSAEDTSESESSTQTPSPTSEPTASESSPERTSEESGDTAATPPDCAGTGLDVARVMVPESYEESLGRNRGVTLESASSAPKRILESWEPTSALIDANFSSVDDGSDFTVCVFHGPEFAAPNRTNEPYEWLAVLVSGNDASPLSAFTSEPPAEQVVPPQSRSVY